MTPYASGRRWTLYAGDSLDVLAAGVIPTTAAIIGDPPYGMDWNPDSTRFTGGAKPHLRASNGRRQAPIIGDEQPFDPAPWLGFRWIVLFGWQHFAARCPPGTTLVWIKRKDAAFGGFLSDADLAWCNSGRGVYCWRETFPPGRRSVEAMWPQPVAGGAPAHPCQKPVGLMAWTMARAKVPADALVCDPWVGSGSTGVAALTTGRSFIGVDVDVAHLDNAARRLERAEAAGIQRPLMAGRP